MQDCLFRNFDITLRGERAPYAVSASYQRRTADGAFHQDVHQEPWRGYLRALGAPGRPPTRRLIEEAGGLLFAGIMQGAVRELWVDARSDMEEEAGLGMRVRLALQPPSVAALPWECLYDPDRRTLFAVNGRTPLLRMETQHRYVAATLPLPVTLPLRLLIAAPEDPTGQIDSSHEIAQLLAVAAVAGQELLQVSAVTGRLDLVALRRRIDDVQPNILHIIAHGQPDGILMWRGDEPAFAPAAALRAILERAPSVRMVFLNACLAGQTDRVPFTTVGPQLLQVGIPAVLAMQFEIRNDAAAQFACFLYEELLLGPCPGAIDAAVGFARNSLYALYTDDFSFGVPVLWLNAEDGYLFRTTPERSNTETLPRLDVGEERRWLSHQSAPPTTAVPSDLQFVWDRWEDGRNYLRQLLDQIDSLHPADADYAAKARTYRSERARLERLLARMSSILQRADPPVG